MSDEATAQMEVDDRAAGGKKVAGAKRRSDDPHSSRER
jgi:hypothetical protein